MQMAARRCFVGWAGPGPVPPLVPVGRHAVWPGPRPLWTLGDWRDDDVRVTAHDGTRIAFLGDCLATEDELRRATRTAVDQSRTTALQGLPGSYAAIIDDGRTVTVITDRAGLHPVFHTALGDGTVFASDALILAALQHPNLVEAVNTTVVAAGLFLPALPYPCDPASVFTGVSRVGPDRLLVLAPHHKPRTHPLLRQTPSASLDEAGVALRKALLTAIDRRVHASDQVSTDLSGGLDSSSVTVLAAHLGSPVAVTYADPYAVNDEDVRFAHAVAATQPRLRHVVTTGSQSTLPFTAMDTTPVTDEPSLDAVIIARTRHRLGPARDHHSEVHLTGDGGDVVLTAPGLTYLGDLARAGRRRALRHEATGWARLRHHPARQVRRDVARLAQTSWEDTLHRIADDLGDAHLAMPARLGLDAQLAWATLSPATPWGTLRVRCAVAGRLRAEGPASHVHQARADSADAVALRAVHAHGAATRGFLHIARTLGVRVAVPFFDARVVTACTAVPAVERTTVDRAKPLLAAALGDHVPPGLLARRTKGDYSACEYHGLRANADRLTAMLGEPLLADLAIVDPEGPREALRLGIAGAPTPMGALGAVLAVETWLRSLAALDTTRWWRPASTQEDTP
jgi:asparagine synthase (glutamine-hydrolysing)